MTVEMPTTPPLTPEELAALPDGTPIIVLWSGGNGPHEYTLARENGKPYARSDSEPADYLDQEKNLYTFVGRERFHTRVWVQLIDGDPHG